MKESYREDTASHSGLEPYAGGGNSAGVASGRGNAGQLWSSEIITCVCRSSPGFGEGNIVATDIGKVSTDTAESENLSMHGHSKRENREIP